MLSPAVLASYVLQIKVFFVQQLNLVHFLTHGGVNSCWFSYSMYVCFCTSILHRSINSLVFFVLLNLSNWLNNLYHLLKFNLLTYILEMYLCCYIWCYIDFYSMNKLHRLYSSTCGSYFQFLLL